MNPFLNSLLAACTVLLLSGCMSLLQPHPRVPGTHRMQRDEALTVLRAWVAWLNANSVRAPSTAFMPDPVYHRYELFEDRIVAHGSTSIVHYEHINLARSNGKLTTEKIKVGGAGAEWEKSIQYNGKTVKYHNEETTISIRFSEVTAIASKGDAAMLFTLGGYISANFSMPVLGSYTPAHLLTGKYNHPKYPHLGKASMILPLPPDRPASEYASALFALCPAARERTTLPPINAGEARRSPPH